MPRQVLVNNFLKEEVFTLKLELGYIQINDIQFSKECKVENNTLYVDPEAVKAFMYEDDDVKAWVKDFSFDVAKPGESAWRLSPPARSSVSRRASST